MSGVHSNFDFTLSCQLVEWLEIEKLGSCKVHFSIPHVDLTSGSQEIVMKVTSQSNSLNWIHCKVPSIISVFLSDMLVQVFQLFS